MFWRRRKKSTFHEHKLNEKTNSAPLFTTPFEEKSRFPALNESIYHAEMKQKISELFQTYNSPLNLKEEIYTFDKSRKMDLFGYITGKKICIEVQVSPLKPESLLQRTLDYSNRGIYVLWILHAHQNYLPSFCLFELQQALKKSQKYLNREEKTLPSKGFWQYSYTTTSTERFLHALYGGKVYYFLEDQITPVHFLKLYQIKHTFEENKPYRKNYQKRRVPLAQGPLKDYQVQFWSSRFKSKYFGKQYHHYEGQQLLLAKFADSLFWL